MLLKNYTEDEQGNPEFDYEVSDEEADVLIRFAIMKLIEMGWIDVDDDNYKFYGDIDNKGGTLQ